MNRKVIQLAAAREKIDEALARVETGLMLVVTRDKRDQALHDRVEELLRQADNRILDPTLE